MHYLSTEKTQGKNQRGQITGSKISVRINDDANYRSQKPEENLQGPPKGPGVAGTLKSFFHRKYREVKAVDDISFSIEEGELVGFIGPNGAGKTTTLKILSGLLYPTSGQVSVLNFNPWQRKPQFQKQIAFVAGQKNQLWWDLPASETFLLNKEIYEVTDTDFKKRINYLSEMLDISDLLKTPVKKLSLGQRMKAELVAALIHSPQVLFLDEPTIGLDIVAQKKMLDFVRSYNQNFGATIILTSHYMGDVEKLCKRVIIINQGKIIYDGLLSKIAQKFTKHKVLNLVFEDEVPKPTLAKFGKVITWDKSFAKIEVARNQIVETTQKLLQDHPVADISIEEPSIEEIIRKIFTKAQ